MPNGTGLQRVLKTLEKDRQLEVAAWQAKQMNMGNISAAWFAKDAQKLTLLAQRLRAAEQCGPYPGSQPDASLKTGLQVCKTGNCCSF
jgi:hypothetical protein